MAQYLDGKSIAALSRQQTASMVLSLRPRQITPGLAVVLVGDDPASQVYVRNKTTACTAVGMANFQHTLARTTTESALLQLVAQLNGDDRVDGILVQLPLPAHIDTQNILAAIDPAKDADGFHPVNMGRLALGLPGPRPCTPYGVMALLATTGVSLDGKSAVVVGRSNIVGKPMGLLLLNANATVTTCHSHTQNLPQWIRQADIVVVAMGRPHFVSGEWIKPGAIVIDVGINRRADGTLCGDVDTAAAAQHAAFITPVPGGVGPMTIAMLLKNTVELAKARRPL